MDHKSVWKKQMIDALVIFAVIFTFSLVIAIVSLYYSVGSYGTEMFLSYLKYKKLVFFHFLPVFCIAVIMYLLTNNLAVSCGITGAAVLLLTWVNYFKLQFRDDPFLFEDFMIISEAKNMTKQYHIVLTPGMIGCIIMLGLVILGTAFLKKKIVIKWLRWSLLFVSILVSALFYKVIYCNEELYESIENYDLVSRWGETQRFISRGFLYPFIYSMHDAFPEKPDGYQKNEVQKIMAQYEYKDIADDKKVNFIGIMLEAYNDFSKFEGVEFDNDPYEKFHEIQKQSYAGELVTNIFAGGTVNTERAFLTGYTDIPNMRRTTRTYVQYFKEQGYKTLGRHQCYGWFYNRKNANENMGFDQYLYYEEGYSQYDIAELMRYGDSTLVDDIISDYEEIVAAGDKCFHFSVSYQNHGPYYLGKEYDHEYLRWKENYNEDGYIIANNYFDGIARTGDALNQLIDYFREQDEPVVVVLFGDHNPWLGDNNSVYKMLGIDLDLDTEEGFYNYYCTPYIIWGNEAAEEVLNVNFYGRGTDVSSSFLMNELFELIGYTGNEYMQYTTELYKTFPVLHEDACVENGKFMREWSNSAEQKIDEFSKVQYYWIHDKK